MQLKWCFGYLSGLWLFTACQNRPGKNTQPRKANDLYATFLFTQDEALEQVTGLFQFSSGRNKKGRYLPNEAAISFDQQKIKGDSISIGEVYYELKIPASRFAGDHQIQLEMPDDRVVEKINVIPVKLVNPFPSKIKREQLEILMKGLTEYDKVQLALIDTAFASNDLHIDTLLTDNRLILSPSRFDQLVNGPLVVYLMIEKRWATHEFRGEVILRYLFRKETELTD